MKYLLIVLLSFNLFADEIFDGREYTITESVTVAWDPPVDEITEFWELRLHYIDIGAKDYYLGRTSELIFVIDDWPRSGHFEIQIRAGRWDEETQQETFSVWVSSTDPMYASVDGESGAWRIFKKVPPPIW